jgi:hypothetical protein
MARILEMTIWITDLKKLEFLVNLEFNFYLQVAIPQLADK